MSNLKVGESMTEERGAEREERGHDLSVWSVERGRRSIALVDFSPRWLLKKEHAYFIVTHVLALVQPITQFGQRSREGELPPI